MDGVVKAAEKEVKSSLSLLDEIVLKTNLKSDEESFDIARRGVSEFIKGIVSKNKEHEPIKKSLVDLMIAEIDLKISSQMNEILHSKKFQAIESAWKGLKLLVDKTNFSENIKIEMLNASKESIIEDLEDAPDVTRSGLYKKIYTSEYGQYGGEPIGAIIANYEFNPTSNDINLLKKISAISAMAHAPFISSVGPRFFGMETFEGLPNIKDLDDHFNSPQFAKWNSFRETEDARYVGLTLPKFLLRQPYDPENNPVKTFSYNEKIDKNHNNYLWGNTAFVFATRLSESFAKFRWCPNIIGPKSGGSVDDLPLHNFESLGDVETKIPTEILVSDRKEFELSEQGFIPLTMRKGSDNAAFFSANSTQRAKFFGNSEKDKIAELNFRLGSQLPYLFVITRLAHYLKVLQREQIGSWKERVDLELELNKWIKQYIADQQNPPAEVRGRRPLRSASILVEDVEGQPGWYRINLSVRPHFKYMGADFTLSLVGKLDKE